MKFVRYILICLIGIAIGWSFTNHHYHNNPFIVNDTIVSPPIVVKEVNVDTLFLLSPTPYLAFLTKDIVRFDSCSHVKERKVYTDDSTYTAWISGVVPSLDSINIYNRFQKETKYVYRNILQKGKRKRWGLGISTGYSYPNGFYVGVGLNYNLFCW